jgi:hypothetical protein
MEFTRTARSLGLVSAASVVFLGLAYGVTLAIGLAQLPSADQPIGDPLFGILEVLILLMAPAMVTLMIAIHAWAPRERRTLSLASLAFMMLLAGVTAPLHFVLLTISRHPAYSGAEWQQFVFAFEWPSLAYAADILAWDLFFPLSMLFAAPVFTGGRLATAIRMGMIVSALLALAGLGGVVTGDMRIRNIGILGYVGGFLVVTALLALLFHRTPAKIP